MAQYVENGAQSRFARLAIAALVPLPAAENVRIRREHERLITGRGCAPHDVLGARALFQDVELYPQAAARARGHILEPRGRHRAQGVGNPEAGGGAG